MPEPLSPFAKNNDDDTDADTEFPLLTWVDVPHVLVAGTVGMGKTSLSRRLSVAAVCQGGAGVVHDEMEGAGGV